MTTIDVSLQLETQQCTCGGGVYAMPKDFLDRCRARGRLGWSCPYCKAWWSWGNESIESKLKAQLEAAEMARTVAENNARADAWRREQAEASAAKSLNAKRRSDAELKRQKIRIHNGVCPCCNRTFVALGRHMAAKHPEYLKQ